jgi:hypothetical protein
MVYPQAPLQALISSTVRPRFCAIDSGDCMLESALKVARTTFTGFVDP